MENLELRIKNTIYIIIKQIKIIIKIINKIT